MGWCRPHLGWVLPNTCCGSHSVEPPFARPNRIPRRNPCPPNPSPETENQCRAGPAPSSGPRAGHLPSSLGGDSSHAIFNLGLGGSAPRFVNTAQMTVLESHGGGRPRGQTSQRPALRPLLLPTSLRTGVPGGKTLTHSFAPQHMGAEVTAGTQTLPGPWKS